MSTMALDYDGILARASLADSGNIPRNPPFEASPDVIATGPTPIADPQTYYRETYEQDVSDSVVAGQDNLIYVRGKNLAVDGENGNMYVYYSQVADLNYPDRWKLNQLTTKGGRASAHVVADESGSIVGTNDPFLWAPEVSDGGKEMVLILVIATNEYPNPVPSLGSPINFNNFVAKRGGIGPYRFTVEPALVFDQTFSTTGSYHLNNEKEEEIWFYVRCDKIPFGTTVSFEAAKPDAKGKPIRLQESTVNNDPYVVSVPATVPAGYSSELTFHYKGGVTVPKKDNRVSVYAARLEQNPSRDTAVASDEEMAALRMAVGAGSRLVIIQQYSTTINVPVQA